MKETKGKVLNLFISIKSAPRENPNEIFVDENGILNDKFYNKDNSRSILLSSMRSYDLAKENNIIVSHGSLGENIVIDIDLYHLNSGDKIIIGEAELEITQNCTICNSLAKVDKKLPKILKNDRGIFAKTIKSGKIRKGDSIKILKY